MSPTVGLLGDVMLGRGVAASISRGEPEEVWSPEVRAICRSCDLIICNLECCISERGERTSRIQGKPFFFRGPPAAVRSLQAIGLDVAGLANNHALDFEEGALLDTLQFLREAGIPAVGAGADESAARQAAIVQVAGTRIGLVAVSDHPAEYAATPTAPGIAYAELARGLPEWLSASLQRLREECDEVIAFVHWGPNMEPNTAYWQTRTAAAMVSSGASLVVGHSAHVFQGVGWSNGSPLLFDLGDALDDYRVDWHLRNDLGLLALWRPEEAEASLELVGLCLKHCRTTLAHGGDAQWIAARLVDACGSLGTSVERLAEQRFRISPA
jgi:Bacterial capsule synthesis protein PGA_cap